MKPDRLKKVKEFQDARVLGGCGSRFALFDDELAWARRGASACGSAEGITSGFGRCRRCPNLPNNLREPALRGGGADDPWWRGGEIAFPRAGQVFNDAPDEPELDIGELTELPPVLFVGRDGGLIRREQEALFAEAKEVFQIIALAIGVPDVHQRQVTLARTGHDEPEGPLTDELPRGI